MQRIKLFAARTFHPTIENVAGKAHNAADAWLRENERRVNVISIQTCATTDAAHCFFLTVLYEEIHEAKSGLTACDW